jgi:hypothetical protein
MGYETSRRRPLFTSRKISGTHLLETKSTPGAKARLEGLGKLKNAIFLKELWKATKILLE